MKIRVAALVSFFCMLPLAQADSIYSIRGLATGTLAGQAYKGWITVNLIPGAGSSFTADLYTEYPQSETEFLNQTVDIQTQGNFIVSVGWDGISIDAAALGYNPYWQSSTNGTPIPLYIGALDVTQFSYGNLTVYQTAPVATPEPISALLLPIGAFVLLIGKRTYERTNRASGNRRSFNKNSGFSKKCQESAASPNVRI